jgi:cell wall hydrolase
MVVAVIPMAGAASDQNSEKNLINNANAKQALELGVTGAEAQNLQNTIQDKKPFGANTEKVIAKTNLPVKPNELKLGSTGDKVKKLQTWLKDYGYYAGAIDGKFGKDTDKAVKQFQEEASIQVDGIVGKETQKAMKNWDQYLAKIQATSETNTDKSSSYTNTKKYTKKNYRRAYRSYRRYRGGYGYTDGLDCWGMSDRLYGQLTSSGQKARIIQYASSMSPRHRSVQVYSGGKWVNYNYKANGYSKAYYATSNSANGKVITS